MLLCCAIWSFVTKFDQMATKSAGSTKEVFFACPDCSNEDDAFVRWLFVHSQVVVGGWWMGVVCEVVVAADAT